MITLLYWMIWALGLTHRKPACPSPPFLSSLQDSPRNPQTAGCCSTATRWVVAQPVASTRITAGRPRTVLIRLLLAPDGMLPLVGREIYGTLVLGTELYFILTK